jgi:hypothetical protein
MNNLLAQVGADPNASPFWAAPNGSSQLWTGIIAALLIGVGMIAMLIYAPVRARRMIVAFFTFLAGGFYVLYFFWPQSIDRSKTDLPVGATERVTFFLEDAMPVVSNFTNILAGFLLGLGIYSLWRVHGRRLLKMQKDWVFSVVLLGSSVLMVIVGYMDWHSRLGVNGPKLDDHANWQFINYFKDFLFEGFLQQMDAAMFSVIAFFILSAAYRAFRIRSIEATVLLASALVVMLSLMGLVTNAWQGRIDAMAGHDPNSFLQNFSLDTIRTWITNTVQTPSIRGIDFGIGIGSLAMGLRLWLSLEKSGTSA